MTRVLALLAAAGLLGVVGFVTADVRVGFACLATIVVAWLARDDARRGSARPAAPAAEHFCSWIYQYSEATGGTVRRCRCGAEEPFMSGFRPRVTVTVATLEPLALTTGREAA